MSFDETDSTMTELDEAFEVLSRRDHKFHGQALRTIQANRDAAIPRLIQSIEDGTSLASTGEKVESNLAFYSLALLAEFRAKAALPAILKAISLPGEAPFELFGDLIHELLKLALADFCADSIETVDRLVSNRSLNEYVRWSSAATYLYLVRNGGLTREEAVERLRKLLQTAIQLKDGPGVTSCVAELYNFAPTQALDDVRTAYRQYLMDASIITLEDFEQSCEDGFSKFQKELDECSSIKDLDTVEFLRHWYWPADLPEKKAESTSTKTIDRGSTAVSVHESTVIRQPIESTYSITKPIRLETPHVGRNDPCPCGGGKKFKKCCGAN